MMGREKEKKGEREREREKLKNVERYRPAQKVDSYLHLQHWSAGVSAANLYMS